MYGAEKWHSCAKGWFNSCETPFRMVSRLQNGGFQGVEVLQPFRSCETGVLGCKMALMCQGGSSQLRKFSQMVLGGCETISQRGGDFHSGSLLLRNFATHALSLLFELLLIPNFLLSHFFDIPLDFDHPKTYITSKQIRIKALKSKLKQVISKTKRYGLASL